MIMKQVMVYKKKDILYTEMYMPVFGRERSAYTNVYFGKSQFFLF